MSKEISKGPLSSYSPGPGDIVPKKGEHGRTKHEEKQQAGGKHRGTPGGFGGHHKHEHPMAHPEVHHASHHSHKGMSGQPKPPQHMLHTGKISERPVGAFRYHEVFDKK